LFKIFIIAAFYTLIADLFW